MHVARADMKGIKYKYKYKQKMSTLVVAPSVLQKVYQMKFQFMVINIRLLCNHE
jgi:hypothetical protein